MQFTGDRVGVPEEKISNTTDQEIRSMTGLPRKTDNLLVALDVNDGKFPIAQF